MMLSLAALHALLRNHQGFNLVEAAIVLGVVGLVIGGIWVSAAAVREEQVIRRLSTGAIVIQSNLRALYFGVPSSSIPTGILLNTTAGWNMGVFQGAEGWRLDSGAGVVRDPNDMVTVAGITNASDGSRVNLGFLGLTQSRCIKLITTIVGASGAAGLYEVYAGSNYYYTFPFVATTTHCPAATGNSAIFRFDR